VRSQLGAARRDGVGRLIIDTALTELLRAYQKPAAFLEVIGKAAGEAKRLGLATAYYLTAFEVRREKKDQGASLADCCRDWAQVTLDGKPFIKTRFGKDEFWNKKGDEALWACPNNPVWKKTFLGLVQGAVRKGARTIFLDVPYLQGEGKQATCRCRHCQARFKKETGQSIPERRAPGSYAYHRWLWWRHEVIAGFLRDVRAAMRQVDGQASLVVEEHPSYVDGATTATGLDAGLIGGEVDLFAHEYSAQQFQEKPVGAAERLELAATLALYRGLDGERPSWVLSYAPDVASSRAAAALHLAYDASFWETKGPEMNGTTVSRAFRKQLFDWYAKQRGAFGATRSLADVGVLYSPASRDFAPDHFWRLREVVKVLTEARVPFRVVSTRDLGELRHLRTLVLPSVVALGEREAAALRGASARLLVVGEPPAKDEWGLAARDHRLKFTRAPASRLAASLASVPLRVEGGPLAVTLLQRAGEVQVRLASLTGAPVKATVSLRLAGVREATQLALLGKEERLDLQRSGDTLRASVTVKDLLVLRLRIP